MKRMLQLNDPELCNWHRTATRLEDYVRIVFDYFSLDYQNYISVKIPISV